MKRYLSAIGTILAFTFSVAIAADTTPSSIPQRGEAAFVASVAKDLNARFATSTDAEKAGYFRYTNEDRFGAISYTNAQWQSSDPRHPSQLWYSVNGKLLGADYSAPRWTSSTAPRLWGVNPRRWIRFRSHVHSVVAGAYGRDMYENIPVAKFAVAGGNINKPEAATLVKMGIAKSPSDVKHVFLFPAIWDLEVWVTPNPSGAFARTNPLVKPSANATTEDA